MSFMVPCLNILSEKIDYVIGHQLNKRFGVRHIPEPEPDRLKTFSSLHTRCYESAITRKRIKH